MVPVHASGPLSATELPQAAEAEDLAQDVRERVLEVAVRHHVDHGVERGVEVPDPEEDADDDVRAVAVVADGHGQVPGEEGQPADEEGAHDDAQGDEGLVLLPPGRVDSVPLTQPCTCGKNEREEKDVRKRIHFGQLPWLGIFLLHKSLISKCWLELVTVF